MRRSVQPNCPRAMTCCFFASLKMLAMPAEGRTAPPPRQCLERLLPMAGFQVSIYGRFWVSTEGMKLSAYIVRVDSGFAPNPFGHHCTLACCKPTIRRKAEPGDIIVGTGSARYGLTGCVVYAMRVRDVIPLQA